MCRYSFIFSHQDRNSLNVPSKASGAFEGSRFPRLHGCARLGIRSFRSFSAIDIKVVGSGLVLALSGPSSDSGSSWFGSAMGGRGVVMLSKIALTSARMTFLEGF